MRPEGSEPILPVLDLPRTRAFYESLGFRAGYHDGRYEILRRGHLVVHLEQTADLVPERNTCSCYWRVADADRLHREFAALGLPVTGLPRITEPQDEPWGMREFTLKDPSGNLLRVGHELGNAGQVDVAGGNMPHGKICYLEIPAKTAEASADFYSSIFGWKVRRRGDGELAFDDPGGVSGTWVKETDRTPDERTRTYIMVDAIEETLKLIQAAGGRVLTPRKDIGPGMGAFAAFADPVGNEFGLYEEPPSGAQRVS